MIEIKKRINNRKWIEHSLISRKGLVRKKNDITSNDSIKLKFKTRYFANLNGLRV